MCLATLIEKVDNKVPMHFWQKGMGTERKRERERGAVDIAPVGNYVSDIILQLFCTPCGCSRIYLTARPIFFFFEK